MFLCCISQVALSTFRYLLSCLKHESRCRHCGVARTPPSSGGGDGKWAASCGGGAAPCTPGSASVTPSRARAHVVISRMMDAVNAVATPVRTLRRRMSLQSCASCSPNTNPATSPSESAASELHDNAPKTGRSVDKRNSRKYLEVPSFTNADSSCATFARVKMSGVGSVDGTRTKRRGGRSDASLAINCRPANPSAVQPAARSLVKQNKLRPDKPFSATKEQKRPEQKGQYSAFDLDMSFMYPTPKQNLNEELKTPPTDCDADFLSLLRPQPKVPVIAVTPPSHSVVRSRSLRDAHSSRPLGLWSIARSQRRNLLRQNPVDPSCAQSGDENARHAQDQCAARTKESSTNRARAVSAWTTITLLKPVRLAVGTLSSFCRNVFLGSRGLEQNGGHSRQRAGQTAEVRRESGVSGTTAETPVEEGLGNALSSLALVTNHCR